MVIMNPVSNAIDWYTPMDKINDNVETGSTDGFKEDNDR